MPAADSGRVFINYRRQDARGSTGRISDRAAERFGGGYMTPTILPDWRSQPPGARYPRVPVLVEDATMPLPHELPESLAELVGRNAHRARHETFHFDTDRLLAAIEPIMRSAATPVPIVAGSAHVVAAGIDPTEVDEPSPVHVLRHYKAVNAVVFSPVGGGWPPPATISRHGCGR
jgi:hypothetical protein